MRLAGRKELKGRKVVALLRQNGKMHISALAEAVYGAACRRSERRLMRVVAKLRLSGIRIGYNRRQRSYVLLDGLGHPDGESSVGDGERNVERVGAFYR